MKHLAKVPAAGLLLVAATHGAAQAQESFRPGNVIQDHGRFVDVPEAEKIPADTRFRISFDVSRSAKPGSVSRSLGSGARFLNMHEAAGVAPDRMDLVFVLHGPAVFDVTKDAVYSDKNGEANASAGLVADLTGNGVRIIVCGQSAAAQGLGSEDLLPGVEMALSAMTAHALLQQDGYTLNPF